MSSRRIVDMVFLSTAILVSTAIPATAVWWSAEPDIFVDEAVVPPYVVVAPAEGPAPPGATISMSAGVICTPSTNLSSCWIYSGNWWMVEFDHPVAANRLRIQLNNSDDNDGTMHVDVDADDTIDFSHFTGQPTGEFHHILVLGAGFGTISAVKIMAAEDGDLSLDYVALGRQLVTFPTTDGRWSGGEWRYSPGEAHAMLWTDFFVPAQGPAPVGAVINTRPGNIGCPPVGWPPNYAQFCWLYGSSGDWWQVTFFPELSYLKMYIRFRDCDNNDGWAEVYVNGILQVAYDAYYPTEPGNNPTNGLLVGRGLPPVGSVEIMTIPGDGDVSLDYVALSDPPIPPN